MRSLLALSALFLVAGCVVVEPPPRRVIAEPSPPPREVVWEDPPEPDPARSVYLDPPDAPPPPIGVRYLPPPMRYEPPPPMPTGGMYWVGGYWVWDEGEWVWMSGHWVLPPHAEWVWVAPYYEVRGPIVVFVAGHWGPPGYVFRPPPPGLQIAVVEARPAYRATLVVDASFHAGCFVPAPPGSRPGIVVPAPVGTPPQVVVSAPPVVRPGMVVRGNVSTTVINNNVTHVTVVAPAGVTRTGEPVQATVPARPALAAALPPRAAVAPPPPPAQALNAHPTAFSPVAVRPPPPGPRTPLAPMASSHPMPQALEARPAPARGEPRPATAEPAPAARTLPSPSPPEPLADEARGNEPAAASMPARRSTDEHTARAVPSAPGARATRPRPKHGEAPHEGGRRKKRDRE